MGGRVAAGAWKEALKEEGEYAMIVIGGTDRLDCRPCGGGYPALWSGVEKVKDSKHGACM